MNIKNRTIQFEKLIKNPASSENKTKTLLNKRKRVVTFFDQPSSRELEQSFITWNNLFKGGDIKLPYQVDMKYFESYYKLW